MNSHKNARMTFAGRKLLIERIGVVGLMAAAEAAAISPNRFKLFAQTCQALGIKHRFTRPYRPQTNGKAERFIQTCLREWAYAWDLCQQRRTRRLAAFLAYYNTERRHSALGYLSPVEYEPRWAATNNQPPPGAARDPPPRALPAQEPPHARARG